MSSFRIFYILILNLCVMNSFGFWPEDYKPFGGMSYTDGRHALVFKYITVAGADFVPEKKNVKEVNKLTDDDTSYPYINFYSSSELKEVKAKIDATGFVFGGKKICAPRVVELVPHLCPNPLMKFKGWAKNSKNWYVTIEFDRFVNQDVVETNYEGTKLFFKLSDAHGRAKPLSFDLSEMRPEGMKYSDQLYKVPKTYSFVWIRPSSKSIREENYKKVPGVTDFLSKIKTCIKKKDYTCIKNNSGASYEEYFLHFSNFYSNSSNDFFSPNYKENDKRGSSYQTQSMLASLEDCLMNGEVLHVYGKESSSFTLAQKSYKKWKTGTGEVVPFMRCGLSAKAADPKVKNSKDEIKLFFTTEEYL